MIYQVNDRKLDKSLASKIGKSLPWRRSSEQERTECYNLRAIPLV